jgi:hypothetical protein
MTNRFGGFLGEGEGEDDSDSQDYDPHPERYERYPHNPPRHEPRVHESRDMREQRGPHRRTSPQQQRPGHHVPSSVQAASLGASRMTSTGAPYVPQPYPDQSAEISKLQAKIKQLEYKNLGQMLPPLEGRQHLENPPDVWMNRVGASRSSQQIDRRPEPPPTNIHESQKTDVLYHTPDYSTVIQTYVYQTITDNGQTWGQISSLYNTKEKINYRKLPEQHTPIYLSIFTYVTLTVHLSWFPIPAHPTIHRIGDHNRLPLNSHTFKVMCYRDYSSGKVETATYRCRIQNGESLTNSEQEAAIQDGSLHFSARLFKNTDDILNVKQYHAREKELYYLDLKVGYNPSGDEPSLDMYNIYWRAHIEAHFSQL